MFANVAACGSSDCVTATRSMGSRLLAPTDGAGGRISPVLSTSPKRKANPNPPAVSAPSETGSRVKCCPCSRDGATGTGGGSACATEADSRSAPSTPWGPGRIKAFLIGLRDIEIRRLGCHVLEQHLPPGAERGKRGSYQVEMLLHEVEQGLDRKRYSAGRRDGAGLPAVGDVPQNGGAADEISRALAPHDRGALAFGEHLTVDDADQVLLLDPPLDNELTGGEGDLLRDGGQIGERLNAPDTQLGDLEQKRQTLDQAEGPRQGDVRQRRVVGRDGWTRRHAILESHHGPRGVDHRRPREFEAVLEHLHPGDS